MQICEEKVEMQPVADEVTDMFGKKKDGNLRWVDSDCRKKKKQDLQV